MGADLFGISEERIFGFGIYCKNCVLAAGF